jgi:hypothetical protein
MAERLLPPWWKLAALLPLLQLAACLRSAGGPDGGPASCTIGGETYHVGVADPSHPCRMCQPVASTVDWTYLRDGSPCADGSFCLSGLCLNEAYDAGYDGGTGGGRGCKVDLDCAIYHTRCNPADGGCVVPPDPCDPSKGGLNCNRVGLPYCTDSAGNNVCFCRPDHSADAGGYCYPQLLPCAHCTNDLDCGSAGSGPDNVGVCTLIGSDYPGGVCLRLEVGGNCDGPSGGGFVPGTMLGNGRILCECPGSTCPCGPCQSDADCPNPALGVCDQAVGTCHKPCLPFGSCPCPDPAHCQVCSVMDKYLDPTTVPLGFFGAGRCSLPCKSDADCAAPYFSIDGGVPLHCNGAGACNPPPGWCLTDLECAGLPHPGASLTPWCDVWADGGTHCNTADCRIGTDTHDLSLLPPFKDCLQSFECLLPDGGAPDSLPDASEGPGLGLCEPVPCGVLGAAFQYGCLNNQFCCGAGDAGAQNLPCTLGQCFCAPNPTWCTYCNSAQDCQSLTGFVPGPTICAKTGFGANHCAVSCDETQPWTCPAGGKCAAFGFGDDQSCPSGTTAASFPGPNSNTLYGCRCTTGLCSSTPVVGSSAIHVGSCVECPDATTAGCQVDSTGQDVCFCRPDGGDNAACHSVPGANTYASCFNVQGSYVCANGAQMVWSWNANSYVLSENCVIRSCQGSGSIDAGC